MSSSIRRKVAVTREGFREDRSIVPYVTSRDSSSVTILSSKYRVSRSLFIITYDVGYKVRSRLKTARLDVLLSFLGRSCNVNQG